MKAFSFCKQHNVTRADFKILHHCIGTFYKSIIELQGHINGFNFGEGVRRRGTIRISVKLLAELRFFQLRLHFKALIVKIRGNHYDCITSVIHHGLGI